MNNIPRDSYSSEPFLHWNYTGESSCFTLTPVLHLYAKTAVFFTNRGAKLSKADHSLHHWNIRRFFNTSLSPAVMKRNVPGFNKRQLYLGEKKELN